MTDPSTTGALIERYRSSFRALSAAAAELSAEQLDARPGTEEWSPRQVIHHVADVALMGGLRLRLMLVDVMLEYWSYEHSEFQAVNHYERPIHASLALIGAVVESSAEILERLDPPAWERLHPLPTGDQYTAQGWLRANTRHLEEHAAQIASARRPKT